MSSANTEEIHLEPYNVEWPKRFEKEAAFLRTILDNELIVGIEHFGSTAIPGITAKPIIDMLVGVKSLPEAKKFIPILEKQGYAYWAEDPRKDGYFLVKGLPPNGPRTFHIHITQPDSESWERLIFRDYMRSHPEEVKNYEKLKVELMEKFKNDREGYTQAKTDYVGEVMKKARVDLSS